MQPKLWCHFLGLQLLEHYNLHFRSPVFTLSNIVASLSTLINLLLLFLIISFHFVHYSGINDCRPGYIFDEERGQCGLCSFGCCWHEPHNLTMDCFNDAISVDPEEEATTIATTVATTERDYSCNKVDDCYSKKRCSSSQGCKCWRKRCSRVPFCKSTNVGLIFLRSIV